MKRLFNLLLLLTVLCVLTSAALAADTDVTVSKVKRLPDGTGVTVTVSQSGTYHFVCASYAESGAVKQSVAASAELTAGEAAEVKFEGFDASGIAKLFAFDSSFAPVCDVQTLPDTVIHLNGTSIDAEGIDGVSVSGTTLTVTEAGAYALDGTLTDGRIVVADSVKKKDVTIELKGVNVTCSDSAPFNAGGGKITLVLAADTENTFTDSGKYKNYTTEKEPKGCFYCRRDLKIEGSGTLTVNGNVKNGLVCGADIEIGKGASVSVTAADNAIRGSGSVKITKKANTVYAEALKGDALKTDAIETDENDSSIRYIEPDKGNVTVNGGVVTLIAPKGDGIQADRGCKITGGKLSITAGGEAVKANESRVPEAESFDDIAASRVFVSGRVEISGGEITASAGEDAIKGAESILISGGTMDITSVNDALQSDGTLTVTGGTIKVKAGGGHGVKIPDNADISAKGLKAETLLSVSGGDITVDSADDALHSNLSLTITGGNMLLSTGDDAVHAEYRLTLGTEGGADDDFFLRITNSYEGLEASVIEVLSGTMIVVAADDGVNAAGEYTENGVYDDSTTDRTNRSGLPEVNTLPVEVDSPHGMLYLKGGMLYVKAGADGLDSNGNVLMTGGTVVVDAVIESFECTFDYNEINGKFELKGGMLVGIGVHSMTIGSMVSNQPYYESTKLSGAARQPVSFRVSGETYTITPTRYWEYLFVSAPGFEKGSVNTSAIAGTTQIIGISQGNIFYGLSKQVQE